MAAQIWGYIKSSQLILISLGLYFCVLVIALATDWVSNIIRRRRSRKNFFHKSLKLRRPFRGQENAVPIEVIKFFANLAVCVAYVYSTYAKEIKKEVWILYRIVGTFVAAEFLYSFTLSESKFSYTVNRKARWSRFFNLVSIPSLFLPGHEIEYFNGAFLRGYCALQSYEFITKDIETSNRKFNAHFSHFYQKNKDNLMLFMRFLALIYILAAGYQIAEITKSFIPFDIEPKDWSPFNSLWFIVVTLSTVGYGDMSPVTIQGRAFVLIMIVLGINIVYNEWKGRLGNSMEKGPGQGKFGRLKDLDHVLIIGNPTLEELKYFIKEFYALYSHKKVGDDDPFRVRHSPLAHTREKIVVLLEKINWTESEWNEMLSKHEHFKNKIKVLVGKYDDENSFKRAKLKSAFGVFILSTSSARKDKFEVDKNTVELALKIRKDNEEVPIYSQTLLDESNIPIRQALNHKSGEESSDENTRCKNLNFYKRKRDNPGRFPTQVLWDHEKACLKDIKGLDPDRIREEPKNLTKSALESCNLSLESFFTSLLAANIKANGLSTMITNLYFDFGFPVLENRDPWLKEFHMGAASKILPALIPKAFSKYSIQTLSPLLARKGVIFVGYKTEHGRRITTVLDIKEKYPEEATGFFLTYLDIHDLCIALRLIRDRLDKIQDIEIQKIQSDQPHGPTRSTRRSNWQWKWRRDNPAPYHQDELKQIGDLKGHIIVAIECEKHAHVTDRLYNFQKLLRNDEELAQDDGTPAKDTIVVIHPTFWKPSSKETDIYFVPGNSNKKSTWEKANFRNCRAIVTMSDKNKKHSEADESTLFTLLMLDKYTKPTENIYICSEILTEESLQLFRTPGTSRRTRLKLGYEGIERSGEGKYRIGNKSKENVDQNDESASLNVDQNDESASINENQQCWPCDKRSVIQRAEMKRKRDVLFSSVRYTSGELVVYSSASSLLVREYSEPGFIDFMMGLCGGGGFKSNLDDQERQKVFLSSIPENVFGNDETIEYEIIFEQIIALGATPLGLYRSGNAPVCLPENLSRKMRGESIRRELEAERPGFCDPLSMCYPQNKHGPQSEIPKEGEDGKNKNILPYVYTLPDMETKVHKFDAVYVLYDPSKMDFYRDWGNAKFKKESVSILPI